MKNETNVKLKKFHTSLEMSYIKEKKSVKKLEEKNLTECEIQWSATKLIMSSECYRIYKNIGYDIIDFEIVNDELLSKYAYNKMEYLVSYLRSLRHNSICPWNNAINISKREAILKVMDFLNEYL